MSTEKIKILYVIDSLCMGGANKLTIDTINLLDGTLFERSLLVLCNFNPQSTLLLKYLSDDVRFFHLNIFDYKFYKRIKILKELFSQYDIVHSCLELSNFYCGLTRFFLSKKVKFVTTLHGPEGVFIEDEFLRNYIKENVSKKYIFEVQYLQTLLFKFYDGYIAVSENMKEFFVKKRKVDPNKVKVLFHGILFDEKYQRKSRNEQKDLKLLFSINENDFVIGYAGRLTYGKGLEGLIEVFSHLQNSLGDIILLLIGDGENKKNLETIIKRLNLDKKCIITGFKDNVDEYYEILNLFVLPSYSETTSLVLQEAIFHEVPVVCSDAGSLPEIIKDGVNGFIFKVGDFEMLEEKITYMYENVGKLNNIIIQAKRDILEKFDLRKNILQIQKYLEEIYQAKAH